MEIEMNDLLTLEQNIGYYFKFGSYDLFLH